jgi:hypothetical protein
MNLRVKELAVEARLITVDGITRYASDYEFEKRFAELIVREMLVTCEEHPAWTGRMIGNQIKEHFGVEEC